MSEQIKMPDRHFLCRDYLHILLYIKFLLFVCFTLPIRSLQNLRGPFTHVPDFVYDIFIKFRFMTNEENTASIVE